MRIRHTGAEGAPTLIDELPGWHTYLCGIGEKGSFLLWFGRMDYEKITKYTLSGSKLSETVLFDSSVPFQGYHELTGPDEYAPDYLVPYSESSSNPQAVFSFTKSTEKRVKVYG